MFYEKAINNSESIPDVVLERMPENWAFGFRYFPSTNPVNVSYDKLPKNNLVLTDIKIVSESGRPKKIISDPKVLEDWADLLEVERPPLVFDGKLTENQIVKIMDYLETTDGDLLELFSTQSFTKYIMEILNPIKSSSALMEGFDKPIEGLVFKFTSPGEKEVFQAKLIEPSRIAKPHNITESKRTSNDMYQIVMLDVVEYLEQAKINELVLAEDKVEGRYVELINMLFNDYVATNGHKFIGIDFETPEFAKKPEFKININNIQNARTRELLKNDYLQDLYKIMMSSLRKKRKSATDILNDAIMNSLNGIIDTIKDKVEENGVGNVPMDFNSFLRSAKFQDGDSMFEQELFNESELTCKVPGHKPVNIITGRFQPFTDGHLKVMKQIHKQNGLPVVVCIVRGLKTDRKVNPFSEDLQLRMFGKLKSKYKFLEAGFIVGNSFIKTIIDTVRPAYEPYLWGAGGDRTANYGRQIQIYNKECQADNIKVYDIPRPESAVSATKVRSALEIDDESMFKKLTPSPIHNFYQELSTQMETVLEVKAVKSFKEFLAMNETVSVPYSDTVLESIEDWSTLDAVTIDESLLPENNPFIQVGSILQEARINQDKYAVGKRFMFGLKGPDAFQSVFGHKPTGDFEKIPPTDTPDYEGQIGVKASVTVYIKNVESGKTYKLNGGENQIGGLFKRASKIAGGVSWKDVTLESAALLGMSMDCKSYLDELNKGDEENTSKVLVKAKKEITSTLKGKGDWNNGAGEIVASLETMPPIDWYMTFQLGAGLQKFVKSKGLNGWNFIHGKIDKYYKAEEENPMINISGSKANTADVILFKGKSVDDFLKNLAANIVDFESDGKCTLETGEEFYQVSLKKGENKAQLGKITTLITQKYDLPNLRDTLQKFVFEDTNNIDENLRDFYDRGMAFFKSAASTVIGHIKTLINKAKDFGSKTLKSMQMLANKSPKSDKALYAIADKFNLNEGLNEAKRKVNYLQ